MKYKIGQCHKYSEKLINPRKINNLPKKVSGACIGNFGLNIINKLTTNTEITLIRP